MARPVLLGPARVFGPQNEGHKFRRKRNLSLVTSMAKTTPKHLSRMVEREVHLECLGASVERPLFFHECGRHVGGVPRSS